MHKHKLSSLWQTLPCWGRGLHPQSKSGQSVSPEEVLCHSAETGITLIFQGICATKCSHAKLPKNAIKKGGIAHRLRQRRFYVIIFLPCSKDSDCLCSTCLQPTGLRVDIGLTQKNQRLGRRMNGQANVVGNRLKQVFPVEQLFHLPTKAWPIIHLGDPQTCQTLLLPLLKAWDP